MTLTTTGRGIDVTLAELLLQVVDYLYGLWPIRIVEENEQGLRWFWGHAKKTLRYNDGWFGSGIHPFVPLLGEIETYSSLWHPQKTDLMDLTTKDGKRLTCQFCVQWRLRDMKTAWTTVENVAESVIEQAEAAAGIAVPQLNEDEAVEKLGQLVHEEVRRLARGWGLEIARVTPTTLVVVEPIRLIQNPEAVAV